MVQVQRREEVFPRGGRVGYVVWARDGDAGPFPRVRRVYVVGERVLWLLGCFGGRGAANDAAVDVFNGGRGCVEEIADFAGTAWGDGVQI